MEAYDSYRKSGLPANFRIKEAPPEPNQSDTLRPPPLSDSEVVEVAHNFFEKFKGIYVDMVFCCHVREESRNYFLRLSPEDAFRVVETEMKYAYEAFYTKTLHIFDRMWIRRRYFALLLEAIALCLWSSEHKHHFRPVDVRITNSLLAGAMFIEILALIRIFASDWNIALSQSLKGAAPLLFRVPVQLLNLLLYVRRLKQTQRSLGVLFRQWKESISQFNFINYCIDERCEFCNSFYSLIGAKDLLDGWRYVSKTSLTKDLRDFIFKELKHRSSMAESIKLGEEISSSRGDWIIRCIASNDLDPVTFDPWIMDVEYDDSVLNWHIATELCYVMQEEPEDYTEKLHRQLSKVLSDYMLYLLVQQPKMMSEAAPMAEVTFQDTCEEARHFFHRVMETSLTTARISVLQSAYYLHHILQMQQCKRTIRTRTASR